MRLTRNQGTSARALATAWCVCVLAALAQGGQAAKPAPPVWKDYASSDGRFAISMPGDPTVSSGTTQTDLGPLVLHTTSVTGDDIYCSVIYQDTPEGLKRSADDILTRQCDGFVQGAHVREIVARRDVTVEGFPGRELEGETADGNFRILVRYIVVGHRIFTLVIGVPIDETDGQRAARFVGSFRLVSV